MKVGGDAFFSDAEFDGSVYFFKADIARNLGVRSAKFQNEQGGGVFFQSMKVGVDAFFNAAEFRGPVYFTRTDIAGDFQAGGAAFQQRVNFHGMKVGGDAFFSDAVFKGTVDLRYADFGSLDLSNTKWPEGADKIVYTQPSSYKYIRPDPQR